MAGGAPGVPLRTFVDDVLQAEFAARGAAVVDLGTSFLDDACDAVERLSRVVGSGLHISTVHEDPAYRRTVSSAVTSLLGPLVDDLFDDHCAFHGNFIIQPPGSAGLHSPHQDWTFVDESQFRSVLLWVPLVAVSASTGAIRLQPGSHRDHPVVRPSPVPHPSFGDPSRGVDPATMQVAELRPGQALAIDHAVLHCSSPNTSDVVRPVLGLFLKPRVAPLLHYHLVDGGNMEVFGPPDGSWLLEMDPHEGPRGLEVIGRVSPAPDGRLQSLPIGCTPARSDVGT
jgi:hypothetical protein